jgi:hypothetical protein
MHLPRKLQNIPQLLREQRDRILREPGPSFQTQTDPTNAITQTFSETFNPKGDCSRHHGDPANLKNPRPATPEPGQKRVL